LEEQLLIAQLHRVKVRVRATEGAGCLVHQIAFDGIGTTMGQHSCRLVWQDFGGVHNLVFDLDFVTDVLTILAFFDLPNFFCHI
jgi:hypothetical protein